MKNLIITPFLQKMLLVFLIAGLAGYFLFRSAYFKDFVTFKQSASPTNQSVDVTVPEGSTPPLRSPISSPKTVINQDPIVNCGPGVNSKQYVKDKQSNCKNYVDCGLSNNVWTMMLKSECDKKHAEESQKNNQQQSSKPPNTTPVFISYFGYTLDCPSQNVPAIQSINSTLESKNPDGQYWDSKSLVEQIINLCK